MPPTDFTTRALEARRIRGLQLAAILALLVAVMRATPWTRGFFLFPLIENYAYDSLFSLSPPEPPSDIVIVAIDDKSLTHLGRFQSWHRDVYAQLLRGPLAGAKVVAFDILFPEPDDHPVPYPGSPLARVGIPQALGTPGSLTADEAFARAMEAHGRVVLAAHWGQGEPPEREVVQRFGVSGSGQRLPRGKPGETLVFPAARLARAAAAIGYVDLDPDPDGVYRRFRPQMRGPDSLVFPHLGTAVARVAAGEAAAERCTVDRDGYSLINYCGPNGTVPRVSLVDVLQDPQMAQRLRDKIVIVGATAPGLYDIRPAPYRQANRMFMGVETNANIVNSLLHRPVLRDVSGSYGWGALALALGLAVGLVVWTAAEGVAVVASLAILLLVAGPSFFVAFRLLEAWIPYGSILLATALPLAVGLPERLTAERRLIQRQFDAYVSPDVLRELMTEPDLIRRSQRRMVTLLFSDVRGSTTLSEKIPPETWVAQLNEYLTQMSLAIFSYDGYLDKFMGDGIMAVWNAFGTQPDDHAERAVRAGLQMLRRLDLLTRKWEQMEDRTPFRIGIGIHSGEAVMGNVGSEERTQFTAIGDVVNTASRIEGMCKQFKVEFIISEDTARLVGDLFPLRELGETEVRGRTAPIKVYEVLQQPPAADTGGERHDHVWPQEEGEQGSDR